MAQMGQMRRVGRMELWQSAGALALIFFGAVLAFSAGRARGADWPNWLGPERNGISRETGLLKSWPAAGPAKLWAANLGEGFSAVSVAGGRVFTLSQEKDGQYALALDEKTGKPLWKKAIGPFYLAQNKYNGARSAPAIEGGVVYIQDGTGDLACLKVADGDVVWKENILEMAGAANNKWGLGSSPLLSGDLLIVAPGNANNAKMSDVNIPPKQAGSAVMALNKSTGNVIWKALDELASYSTPVEFTSGGVEQFVYISQNNLCGLSRKEGKLLWSFPAPYKNQNNNIATPVVSGDMIFFGSQYGVGSTVVQADPAKTPAARLVWKSLVMQPHFTTPVLLDGYLYGYDNEKLVCVNFKTGEKTWSDATILKGQLIYADGLFYIVSERGYVGLARLSPQKCEVLGKFEITPGVQHWTMPVIANGRLYVRDEKTLLCFDIKAK